MSKATHREKHKVSRKRVLHVPAYALAVLVLVPLLAFGVFYARLQAGPIPVPFVGQAIERAVNRSLAGEYVISVEGAVLEPGLESTVALHLINMKLFNASGKLVGAAPFAAAELDLFSLASLEPTASSISFIGPVMVLKWGRAGDVELVPGLVPGQRSAPRRESARPADPADEETRQALLASGGDFLTTGLSRALRQAFARMPVSEGQLERLKVENAILRVEHEQTGAIWRVAPLNFVAGADESGRSFEVSATVLEGAQPWRVHGRVSGRTAEGDKQISVGVEDLVLASATGPLARFSGMPLNVPLSSRFEGTLGAEGAWHDLTFEADLGEGVVSLGRNMPSLAFRGGQIRLVHENDTWAVRRFGMQIGDMELALNGLIAPGAQGQYTFDLTASYHGGENSLLAQDLPEARAVFKGSLDFAQRALNLNTLRLETADVQLSADAYGEWQGERPSFMVLGTASALSAVDIKAIWPSFLLPQTRGWVYDHLISGRARDIFYRFGMDEEGRLIRDMEARVSDATFTYLGDLPAVEDASGRMRLQDDLFTAELDSGFVEPVPDGRIDLAGTVYQTRIMSGGEPDRATIDLKLSGHAAPLFYYLDMPELRLLRQNGLALDDVEGRVQAEGKLRFPILPEVPDEAVEVEAEAQLEDFAADGLVPGRRLSGGTFTVMVVPDGVSVEGRGEVGSAELSLTARRGPSAGDPVQYNAAMLMDAAARAEFGAGAVNDYVSGPVRLVFSGEGRRMPGSFDIDLSQAGISLPQLGYGKPAGTPAQASVRYRETQDEIVLEEIAYDSGPVTLRGKARLSRDGELLFASLPVFRFQEGDDLALELSRQGEGYVLDLRGARFNVAPFLSARRAAGAQDQGEGESRPFSLTASIGALAGGEGRIIRNVELSLRHDGRFVRDLDLAGEHGGGGQLRAWAEDLNLFVESANAGSLLRFLNAYDNMLGGQLFLRAGQGEQSVDGTIRITDFVIASDRLMRSIVARNPNVEPLQELSQQARQGMSFSSLTAAYSYDRNSARLVIDNGVVKGPAAGLTAEGQINLVDDAIRMEGTFVPAYSINNAFSRIPLIGRILGGDKDEGLFGITFRVRGTTDNPQVIAQPLSAITPGIFRRIFE